MRSVRVADWHPLLISPTAFVKRSLDRLADRQHKVVAAVEAGEHEPDRRLTGTVTRQAERATVKEIDHGGISEHEQVSVMVGAVVLFKLGDGWRNDRHCW